jgi:hypothetical protein
MRSTTKMLLRIIAPLVALGAVVLAAGTVLADDYEQLELVINIVQGSRLTEKNAQDMSKEIDDILKQCDKYGLRMRVTPKIRTGVTKIDGLGPPVPGEDVTPAQEKAILKAGEQEIGNKGYKITVIEGFEDPNNAGGTIPGHPSSDVDEWAGSDTWAHEMGHGLGLGHEGDKNNLMHGVAGDRTGTALTKDQCEKLKAEFKKRGAEKKCTEGQQKTGACTPATESVNDAMFDPKGDATNPIVDLEATSFTFDLDPVTPSLLTATRVGLFPGIPVSVAYQIGFDTDNNPATGGLVGPFGGFEFEALVEATGIFPFVGSASASLIKLPEGVPVIPLEAPEFVLVFYHTDVKEAPEVPDEEIAAEVALSIPVEHLGPLANPMRVAVVALSGPDWDVEPDVELGPDTIDTLPAVGPELVVSPRTVYPAQLLSIEGSGYAPLSELTLLLGNELLGETTTSGDGEFSTEANTLPLSNGNYLLDAIDAEGNIGLEVITVKGPVGGVAEPPDVSGASGPNYIALAAVAAGALLALAAGAWYARRRWLA